ncbi:hypothetical protein ON010_g8165 [Phytophthora cinnamomi]|nr:hypothetical protein ON010_g8165 [Phytophthora cinnamomi]
MGTSRDRTCNGVTRTSGYKPLILLVESSIFLPIRDVNPSQVPLPGTPESEKNALSGTNDAEPQTTVTPTVKSTWEICQTPQYGFPGISQPPVTYTELENLYQREITRVRAEAEARIAAAQASRAELEAELRTLLVEQGAETIDHRAEQYIPQTSLNSAPRSQKSEQQLQLEALERLAKQRAEEESQKRKEDETRARYLLDVQRSLKEAEDRARQAERKKAEEAEASRIRTEYESELRMMNEKYAQAQIEHKKAVAIQEEKIRRFQAAQDQHRQTAASRSQSETPAQIIPAIPVTSQTPGDSDGPACSADAYCATIGKGQSKQVKFSWEDSDFNQDQDF